MGGALHFSHASIHGPKLPHLEEKLLWGEGGSGEEKACLCLKKKRRKESEKARKCEENGNLCDLCILSGRKENNGNVICLTACPKLV